MCMYFACIHVYALCVCSVHGEERLEKALNTPEQELQKVRMVRMWVLGAKLRSSARVVSASNTEPFL